MSVDKWLLFLIIPAIPLAIILIRRIVRQSAAIDERLSEVRADEAASKRDPRRELFDLWESNAHKRKER